MPTPPGGFRQVISVRLEELFGLESGPVSRSWTRDEAILYALGVGAGGDDPSRELQFTTEHTAGVPQQVLPTFAVVLSKVPELRPALPGIDQAGIVHAEQAIEIDAPIPVEGDASVSAKITGVYDKGSGAVVLTETDGYEPDGGRLLFRARSSIFIRGAGGFQEPAGNAAVPAWERPQRDPDYVLRADTHPEQALIYRLSGDRNRLHSDPSFAARAGFDRPILHGLCTYGFATRALLRQLCDSDPARFRRMGARFSRPFYAGQSMEIPVWADGGQALFQVLDPTGAVVLDRGVFDFED